MRKLLPILAMLCAFAAPASAQTQATASAVEASHVFCTAACQIYGGQVNNTNVASRWVFLFDATTAPVNGAVTGCLNAAAARPCAIKWYQLAGSNTLAISDFFEINGASRLAVSTGLVVMCSSTGPFTLTAAADCAFSFEVMRP